MKNAPEGAFLLAIWRSGRGTITLQKNLFILYKLLLLGNNMW
jgi:hypothetical protein